ncbi:MAG: PorV/PorQ family protein [bacterium]|nr:MAG: hypothetical protein DIU52_07715 [bacterium]
MRTRTGWLAFALVLATAGELLAQGTGTPLENRRDEPITRTGTRGANFLEIGVGAQAQALGGSYTARAMGPTALYWNTAATALTETFAAGFSHTELFEGSGVTHQFAGALLPTNLGTIGVSVISLSSGKMTRTTEAYPLGGDPQYGGEFEWTATAIGLHYARRITDRLSVGVAGKFVTEGITGANASYVGADLSTLFNTGLYGITLGAALVNIGSSGRMEGQLIEDRLSPGRTEDLFGNRRRQDVLLKTQEAPLPTQFRFGIMMDLVGSATALLAPNPDHRFVVLTDISDAIDTAIQTSIGFEYSFRDILFLRAGKQWLNEARAEHRDSFTFGLGGGAGLRIPLGGSRMIGIDYSYRDHGDLNNTQVISVEVAF